MSIEDAKTVVFSELAPQFPNKDLANQLESIWKENPLNKTPQDVSFRVLTYLVKHRNDL